MLKRIFNEFAFLLGVNTNNRNNVRKCQTTNVQPHNYKCFVEGGNAPLKFSRKGKNN